MSTISALPCSAVVRMPAWDPVKLTAGTSRASIAMATSAIEMRSPAVRSMSSSRRVWGLGDLRGEVDQRVGRLAHRRDDHHHVVSGLVGLDDAAGDVSDSICVGERGAAELLYHECHAVDECRSGSDAHQRLPVRRFEPFRGPETLDRTSTTLGTRRRPILGGLT